MDFHFAGEASHLHLDGLLENSCETFFFFGGGEGARVQFVINLFDDCWMDGELLSLGSDIAKLLACGALIDNAPSPLGQ